MPNKKMKSQKISKQRHLQQPQKTRDIAIFQKMKISLHKNRWTWIVITGLFILVIAIVIIGTILNDHFPN